MPGRRTREPLPAQRVPPPGADEIERPRAALSRKTGSVARAGHGGYTARRRLLGRVPRG